MPAMSQDPQPSRHDPGNFEPTTERHEHVETVAIEGDAGGGAVDTGHATRVPTLSFDHSGPVETDQATQVAETSDAPPRPAETDTAADDTMLPGDAPAVRSAVVAVRGPAVHLDQGPSTPFGSGGGGRPPTRAAGSRRRPAPADPDPDSNLEVAEVAAPAPAPEAARGVGPASSRRSSVSGRRQRSRSLILAVVVILVVAAGAAAIVLLAGHEQPGRKRAAGVVAEATRQLDLARGALSNRQGAQARAAYAAAVEMLAGDPALSEAPGPEVIPELARQAANLRFQAGSILAQLKAVESDANAEANLAQLRARLARLSDPATDLDRLERDLAAFCANPVDPAGPADPVLAEGYSRMVGEVKLRQMDITRERERRYEARVTIPINQARLQSEGLISDERFGEALALIAKAREAHPDADFTPLVQGVNDAAAKAWRAAKAYVDTRIADAKAPGTTERQRQASYKIARERLNQVVARFGVDEYVRQAQAILAALP